MSPSGAGSRGLTTLMLTKALNKRAWELMGMRTHMQMSTDLLELATYASDVRAHMGRMREAGGHRPRQAILNQQEKEKR